MKKICDWENIHGVCPLMRRSGHKWEEILPTPLSKEDKSLIKFALENLKAAEKAGWVILL